MLENEVVVVLVAMGLDLHKLELLMVVAVVHQIVRAMALVAQ
jgi:hypothetical protein